MSQKETLIKFLKSKNTTFSVDEVNAMVNIINTLQEPAQTEAKESTPKNEQAEKN